MARTPEGESQPEFLRDLEAFKKQFDQEIAGFFPKKQYPSTPEEEEEWWQELQQNPEYLTLHERLFNPEAPDKGLYEVHTKMRRIRDQIIFTTSPENPSQNLE